MYDLAVAGGGPAGLVTALLAARAGLSAVVLEPRRAPIDKACGEGLMPGAVRTLQALHIDVSGRAFGGIRYTDGRRTAEATFRAGTGLGVRRTRLHAALQAAVVAAGIPIEPVRATDVRQRTDRVEVAGLTARYLAAADGLHSPLRRALGLDAPDRGPRRYGLRRHYPTAPWTDLVEVHWSARTEAYVTPVADDLVGVAFLTTERAPYAEHLARFPTLAARLPPAPATDVRGAGPLRQRVRRRVAGRVLLVGDAAGYVDALTGEGLSVAWAAAAELVACVAADRPEAYERRWRRASRRYRLLTGGLVTARRVPGVAAAIVPAAHALPRTFAAIVNQLAH